MQFMGSLYVGESISTKEHEIVKKVHNGKVVPNLYLIAFSDNAENMLDLIPEWEALQKGYPRDTLNVVGIANGKKEAIRVVQHIVEEALRETKMRIEDKGEYTGLRESRTHIAHFTKSLKGSAAIRGKINFLGTFAEVEDVLLTYASELETE